MTELVSDKAVTKMRLSAERMLSMNSPAVDEEWWRTMLAIVIEVQEHRKADAELKAARHSLLLPEIITCERCGEPQPTRKGGITVTVAKMANNQLTGLGVSHPASEPLTVKRIERVIEALQRSIQYQNGGDMAYVIADAIKGWKSCW